jgi:hypothetical protein
MEICHIYTEYKSSNRSTLNVKKAIGLEAEGNPQNTYVHAEIIDSDNFNDYVNKNNVITTSNISNYSSKSSNYLKIDSVNNISEYSNCTYFIAGDSSNINEGSGPEPNKIYQPKYIPLNDFINGTASGNPVSAFVSNMRWTSTLRLFFSQDYFYDVQFDPNSEHIIHRLVCSGKAKDWHVLLDSNNYIKKCKYYNY